MHCSGIGDGQQTCMLVDAVIKGVCPNPHRNQRSLTAVVPHIPQPRELTCVVILMPISSST